MLNGKKAQEVERGVPTAPRRLFQFGAGCSGNTAAYLFSLFYRRGGDTEPYLSL
jgi:hypothetical protein